MADVSLWVPVITGLAGIGGALGGQYVSHIYARQREKDAASRKRHDELLFITTELVFLLEQFAERCAEVATDHGYENQDGNMVPEIPLPVLDYASVSGDWWVLPAKLMYRIRELPALQEEANRVLRDADAFPPDYNELFEARQYQYTRLGLKAIIQARRLRKLVGYPESRLAATEWSAQPVLWKEWRQERKRRAILSWLRRQTTAQLYVALNHSVKNNTISGDPE